MIERVKTKPGARAMLLAAGLGTRMRPLTNDRPKPLVEVNGKALIDHALEKLKDVGVRKAVVNLHYKADMLEAHFANVKTPEIVFSDERDTLLETGGGIVKALSALGAEPFFVVNTDSLWTEGAKPALARLRDAWNDDTMDCLLLVASTATSIGYSGRGDFWLEPDGTLSRRKESQPAPFVFTGIYLLHPRLFKGAPKGKFSMNVLYDKALKAGRLKGLRHDGVWIEVGTPDAVDIASDVFAKL